MTLRSSVCLFAVVLLLAPSACSWHMPKRPDVFLLPEAELTWEQGEALVAQGERKIQEGNEKIERGQELRKLADQLIEEGRQLRREGEEMAARGREALRAARMLEESEELRTKALQKKQEALPEGE